MTYLFTAIHIAGVCGDALMSVDVVSIYDDRCRCVAVALGGGSGVVMVSHRRPPVAADVQPIRCHRLLDQPGTAKGESKAGVTSGHRGVVLVHRPIHHIGPLLASLPGYARKHGTVLYYLFQATLSSCFF